MYSLPLFLARVLRLILSNLLIQEQTQVVLVEVRGSELISVALNFVDARQHNLRVDKVFVWSELGIGVMG